MNDPRKKCLMARISEVGFTRPTFFTRGRVCRDFPTRMPINFEQAMGYVWQNGVPASCLAFGSR